MTWLCYRQPCGRNAGGCSFGDCPNSVKPPSPNLMAPYAVPAQVTQGCICPPTSEKTCENPICPRQNPLKKLGAGYLQPDKAKGA